MDSFLWGQDTGQADACRHTAIAKEPIEKLLQQRCENPHFLPAVQVGHSISRQLSWPASIPSRLADRKSVV